MRSLKQRQALLAEQMRQRCDSEWPYEVTETSEGGEDFGGKLGLR